MTEQQKKWMAVILAVLALVLLLVFIFRADEDFTAHREMLQEATDQYIADTGCYPSIREVTFGNPSPIDFQKLYHKLDDDFEIRNDLYYWITNDGKVWISETDIPEMELENQTLTYDRQGRLRYYLYYYENGELTREETREKELDLSQVDYAVSEHYGRGLETPPANYNYEGYEKHRPIVRLRNPEESLGLLAMMREQERRRTPLGNMVATIGRLFREEKRWETEYGFDVYGEDIVDGQYEKMNSILGAVKIETEDGRESYWVDLMDPVNVGACYGVDWEIIDIDPVDPTDPDITHPTDPGYDTRTVTVKGGPKRNPDDFDDVISFTTKDGFSGLLYKYGNPFIEDGEEKMTFTYRVREDRDFPETIDYERDGFVGSLTLQSIGKGFEKVTETRRANRPEDLPEKIEYEEEDYYGVLEPVGDYRTVRTGGGSTTRRRDVEEVVTRNDRNFPNTISYSQGGYSGTLHRADSYERIPGDGDSKTITETVTRDDRNFDDYLRYDKDGYEGRLYKDGEYRRIDEEESKKTVSETITQSSRDFDNYITYSKDGYEGRLYSGGDYTRKRVNGSTDRKTVTETVTQSSRDFDDYITYDQDGFSGRLHSASEYRRVKAENGDTETKTVSETVTQSSRDFDDYITYSKDGYEGRLYSSGDYTREKVNGSTDRKTVTETVTQSSRDFDDYIRYKEGGYEGRLEKDGGYRRTTDTKTVTETVTQSSRDFDDYIKYDKDGYEGRLEKDGGYRRNSDGTFEQDYKGEVEKQIFEQDYRGEVEGSTDYDYVYEMKYSGEVEKELDGEYVYEMDYEGEVERELDGEYVYEMDYSGELKRGEVFQKDYEGEVVKDGETRYEQGYTGEVTRTKDTYRMTYTGEVTRRVRRSGTTRYEQDYEGTIFTSEGDYFLGIYSGKVSSGLYYQLYRGILRRARH